MLTRRLALGLFLALSFIMPASAQENGSLDKDGMHFQDWFHQGPKNMQDILLQAGAEGKGMIVLFEQRGCHYCAELHAVNLKHPEVVSFMQENFVVVQMNLRGSNKVVDFDGTVTSEGKLSDRWAVPATPTTLVFAANPVRMSSRRDAETFRLPGYLKPFYYLAAFDFLITGAYEDTRFQTFVEARIAKAEKQGIDPEMW